jgi:hypothetical protein
MVEILEVTVDQMTTNATQLLLNSDGRQQTESGCLIMFTIPLIFARKRNTYLYYNELFAW